jgi:predicted Rossmann fold flavoprotein
LQAQIIVVGGGASGMVAAGRAAELGADVLLLEKTGRLGNKLRITGKGRSNVTNDADLESFIAHFGPNGCFLYGAFSRFFAADLRAFFERMGVPTVVERGGRVFPASNDANEVADALRRYCLDGGVRLRYRTPVETLLVHGGRMQGVALGDDQFLAPAVILATGGASYPATGSEGDGYGLASTVGHSIVPIRPALVPLVTAEPWVPRLQGVSLRNVRATLYLSGDPIASEFGEMLFTHFGISGPIILTLSKRAGDALKEGRVEVGVNLKPALSDDKLDARLRRDLDEHGKREFRNIVKGLVPAKMVDVLVELADVPPDKPAHQVTGEERRRLFTLLRDLRMTVVRLRPLREAIITAGGVALDEVDPRTMESRIVQGLYFCGEVLDLDADTGGYNLQAAFSTGWVAGEAAARAR